MKQSAADLGTRLRVKRESRGLSLQDVAASTKIKASLLSDLEQGDVSRWPHGIYRRAFLRAYADAIGISAGSTLDDLLRQSADPDNAAGGPALVLQPRPGTLPFRLLLAPQVSKPRFSGRQVADAVVVLAAVLAAGALLAFAADMAFSSATAVVALAWYPVSHALFGGFSPARDLRNRHRPSTSDLSSEAQASPPPLRIVTPTTADDESAPVAERTLRRVVS